MSFGKTYRDLLHPLMAAFVAAINQLLPRVLMEILRIFLSEIISPVASYALAIKMRRIFLPGLMLGLNATFFTSLLLLLPYCLVSGFLLTLFSGMGGDRKDATQIGEVLFLILVTGIASWHMGRAVSPQAEASPGKARRAIQFGFGLLLLATPILFRLVAQYIASALRGGG